MHFLIDADADAAVAVPLLTRGCRAQSSRGMLGKARSSDIEALLMTIPANDQPTARTTRA